MSIDLLIYVYLLKKVLVHAAGIRYIMLFVLVMEF